MSTGEIQLSGIRKQFNARTVLTNIDLDIKPGEKIALMGASGCGKTTLLRCINGLEQPDSGGILVNGCDLSRNGVDISRLRTKVGMVFQQFNLFPHLTILDNLTLAPVQVLKTPVADARQQAQAFLDQVGLADHADKPPTQLSSGQQQRVAIARSLMMRPDILLLDEPTSALDPPMSHEVLSLIEQVADQRPMTILMVTHEAAFVSRFCDRLLFMADGQIVADASPDILMKNPPHPAMQAFFEH